jgi:Zn-dependent protease with chaperone function
VKTSDGGPGQHRGISDGTDDEAEAFDRVRQTVRQICADKGLPEARVCSAERIDGLVCNAEFTSHGKTPTIHVTRGAAMDLSPAARHWLLAHEIGHYWYDKAWQRTVLAFTILGILLALAVLGLIISRITYPFSATEILNTLIPPLSWGLLLAMVFSLVFLSRMRAEETRADDFAVLYQGDMIGAEQCLRAWDEDRPQRISPNPLTRKLRLLRQSHPWRSQRLASMTKILERYQPTL